MHRFSREQIFEVMMDALYLTEYSGGQEECTCRFDVLPQLGDECTDCGLRIGILTHVVQPELRYTERGHFDGYHDHIQKMCRSLLGSLDDDLVAVYRCEGMDGVLCFHIGKRPQEKFTFTLAEACIHVILEKTTLWHVSGGGLMGHLQEILGDLMHRRSSWREDVVRSMLFEPHCCTPDTRYRCSKGKVLDRICVAADLLNNMPSWIAAPLCKNLPSRCYRTHSRPEFEKLIETKSCEEIHRPDLYIELIANMSVSMSRMRQSRVSNFGAHVLLGRATWNVKGNVKVCKDVLVAIRKTLLEDELYQAYSVDEDHGDQDWRDPSRLSRWIEHVIDASPSD